MFAKLFNAGQVCVGVDYLFVPEDRVAEFVQKTKAWVAKHCPDINSPDFTSIIDQKSLDRLNEALADAEQRGRRHGGPLFEGAPQTTGNVDRVVDSEPERDGEHEHGRWF